MAVATSREQTEGAKVADGGNPPSQGKKKPHARKPMPDVARLYIEDQAKAQTPMVFVTREGELQATVIEGGMYEHLLRVDGEPTPVRKLTLEYHYKQVDACTVAGKIGHDAGVDTEGLPSTLLYHPDHRLSNKDLWISRKQDIPVRFTMREAAQFTGLIEWFTPYAIKLNIGLRGKDGTASVILHRHAVVRLELLAEPKEDLPPDQKSSKG
jgi:hypothetical protein